MFVYGAGIEGGGDARLPPELNMQVTVVHEAFHGPLDGHIIYHSREHWRSYDAAALILLGRRPPWW
jgi:hypothetical protein